MEIDVFKGESFKQLLKEKSAQIHLRIKDGIQDSDNFKLIHRVLISYQKSRPITDFKAIIISESEIRNLTDNLKSKLFSILDSHDVIINNHILINGNLDLLCCERKILSDNNEARRFYLELSNDLCVFLISPKSVHYFLKGNDVGDAIFFTSDALKAYNELKDIGRILEVFDDYRKHLRLRATYNSFFVSNSAKKSLYQHLKTKGLILESEEDFLKNQTQLLENKPEDRLREDLRLFLKSKLKASLLGKEYILESFKRLDIFIADELGDLYLIEVKWVGISIHASGTKIGTEYKGNHINPDAVKQSVNYIKELYENSQKIKIGYLVVFDARNNDMIDTLDSFDENQLPNEQRFYFPIFKKVPDFRVKNLHPV